MAYITCSDLSVGYNGCAVASHINFEVNKGDYLCIVGVNGAGKSTLMRSLLHLQEPLGGLLEAGDGLKPFEIGYLPQQSDMQKDFPATVWEVVLSGTLSRSRSLFYSTEQKKIAKEKMEQLGIWDLRKRSYRALSGGQQQRTLLARALAATSKLLLLDEPVTGLDPQAMNQLYELTDELHKSGVTIIMVTHDLCAVDHATHVLHIDRAHCFFGTKEKYRMSEQWQMFQEWEEADGTDQ